MSLTNNINKLLGRPIIEARNDDIRRTRSNSGATPADLESLWSSIINEVNNRVISIDRGGYDYVNQSYFGTMLDSYLVLADMYEELGEDNLSKGFRILHNIRKYPIPKVSEEEEDDWFDEDDEDSEDEGPEDWPIDVEDIESWVWYPDNISTSELESSRHALPAEVCQIISKLPEATTHMDIIGFPSFRKAVEAAAKVLSQVN